MSDIIIFPKLGDGLNRQLEEAVKQKNYERAYEIILEMERHIELSDRQQLMKLEILKALESFLELREEASIMLNQGHPAYNEVVEYFLISLFELGQYQTVIELINSLRSEQVDHQLIVRLLPLFDRAKHRLNELDASFDLNLFINDTLESQMQQVVKLINNKNYKFISSFVWLIEHQPLHPMVQTLIIEYILESSYSKPVKLMKLGEEITVHPDAEKPYESYFVKQVIPLVLEWCDNQVPAMTDAINEWLKVQNMLIYPLTLDDPPNIIAESLIIIAMQMFENHEAVNFNETEQHINIIERLIQMNQALEND